VVAVTQLDIASSDIRNRLRGGRSIDFLVPESVHALIHRHGLYR
jgi:nicotinate-nucleotide adenylyltransferase